MDPRVEKIMAAADYIAAKLEGKRPFAGIVLGSGLGKLADKIENQIVIPYREIPGFPVSTAVGHKGNFIAGDLGGKPPACVWKTRHSVGGRFRVREPVPRLAVEPQSR